MTKPSKPPRGVKPPVAQAVVWLTGFETGDNGEVVTTGTGQTIQTTTVRTGGYALKTLSGTTTCEMVAGLSATQWALRFYMQLSGSVAGFHAILEQTGSGTSRLALDVTSASKLQVNDQGATLGLSTTTGSTVLSTGVWYRIELRFDAAAGGVVQVLINGVSEINVTHSSNVSGTVATIFRGFGGDATNAVYYDDAIIATGGTTAIGPGQISARQGLNSHATTPHYNAWTKNGGTDAGTNWSDTPASTSKNCSTASNGAAQTMVVDKFSVDPSRAVEGTQVIPSGATINACRVVALGKTSSTTGGATNWSIRRRVNSTDTDSVVTLATFDTYVFSEVFTDTAANLDGYEIGAVATSIRTETVEDMWLMVDYNPVTNYTFTLGVGSFTLTGEPLTFPVTRKAFSLGVGTFTLTGEPLTISRNLKAFSLDVGAFTLTGKALTLPVSRSYQLGVGVFTLMGEPLTFPVARKAFAIGVGAFSVTGEPMTLPVSRNYALGVGVFSFTGVSLSFVFPPKHYVIALDTGAFHIAGYTPMGFRVTLSYAHGPGKPPKEPAKLVDARLAPPLLDNWRNHG